MVTNVQSGLRDVMIMSLTEISAENRALVLVIKRTCPKLTNH